MARSLKIDWLRTLVLVNEFGSIARAAHRLGRPVRSLGFHMRRLEDEVGVPVYRRHHHDVQLTEAGRLLVGYARRMLELHDDALESVFAINVEGVVRLGIPQDVEARVTPVLARFSRLHEGIRIETRVDRSQRLIAAVEQGALELALAFTQTNGGTLVLDGELAWIGARGAARPSDPLPLALLEPPCVFREVALFTLEQAGRPYRIVFTSPSLSSLWTAVSAGLGFTVRTRAAMPAGLAAMKNMPPLPPMRLMLYSAPDTVSHVAKRLRDWLLQHLREGTALGAPHPAP